MPCVSRAFPFAKLLKRLVEVTQAWSEKFLGMQNMGENMWLAELRKLLKDVGIYSAVDVH